jgi:hypothetical protein
MRTYKFIQLFTLYDNYPFLCFIILKKFESYYKINYSPQKSKTMSTPTVLIIRRATAVLKSPKNIDKLIIYFRGIYDKMNADTRYSGSAAKLTLFNDQIKKLYDSQAAFKAKPPTITKADRDAAKSTVVLTAESLQRDVQELADANIPDAESIITGANMSVRIITVRGPQQNSYEWGDDPEYLTIYAEGEGTHEWQSSEDGEAWNNDGATGVAKKTYTEAEAEKINYSRNRQVLTHGKYSPWSNPLTIDRK